KRRLDSLQVVTPNGHLQHDTLMFALYGEYKTKYLNLGSEGQGKEALPIVLACEATFTGKLPQKEEDDLIYNTGYLYDKCEKYVQALAYFHRSIALYEAIQEIGEQDVRNDIALAYNNIGVVHAHTGFFSQRRESYLKAKALWESIDGVDKSNLISLYGNLLRLYLQYGDKQAAG